jgi:hypothetical protein
MNLRSPRAGERRLIFGVRPGLDHEKRIANAARSNNNTHEQIILAATKKHIEKHHRSRSSELEFDLPSQFRLALLVWEMARLAAVPAR